LVAGLRREGLPVRERAVSHSAPHRDYSAVQAWYGSDMKVFVTYFAPLLVLLLFFAGVVAQVAVDAHHWMPHNWWTRSPFKKK
jgi:hypothetical protein